MMSDMGPPEDFVFVYGTLKRGGRYHETMVAIGAQFLGTAAVVGRLISLGDYPGLLPGSSRVSGEVYRVSAAGLRVLDRLEGFDAARPASSEYHRRLTPLHGGPVAVAWVYWYNPALVPATAVPLDGDWPPPGGP
jgi:gamma-glutamylcyclotransferase (GGCT)/AIG2-like uncharacterized protein YtfP